MSNAEPLLPPGFRFHPTDEELILHYLKNRASSTPCPVSIIAEVNIYKFDPWDLPAKAAFGDKEWYFFSPRDRKYPNGVRPNRAARSGYWKATGTDKPIRSCGEKESIGVKKALVFYIGKPPRGTKTDWIMHEYRLAESVNKSHHHMPIRHREASMRLDDWVLCRIYNKGQNHNSDIPTVEPEREDSNIETSYFSGLPKAGSLSELLADVVDYSSLSRLLYDNPHDHSRQEQLDHLFEYPSVDHQSGFHANSHTGCVGVKRDQDDYAVETAGSVMNPSKKLNTSCTPTNLNYQMDTAQYSSNYFNHQLLMDSHLGLH